MDKKQNFYVKTSEAMVFAAALVETLSEMHPDDLARVGAMNDFGDKLCLAHAVLTDTLAAMGVKMIYEPDNRSESQWHLRLNENTN